MSSRFRDWLLQALCLLCMTWPLLAKADSGTPARTLRVCAHPDNLPFSAQDESGFDNRIARIIADELKARLEFTWFQPQHGLVRKTLGEGMCDALVGLPQGYEGIAASVPYYRSRYVFVYPRAQAATPPSFENETFLQERIGVQVIGDDMAATPPGHALARAHASHVIGFPVYGERPAVARIVDAIANHELDAGVAWGPAAGYFAARSSTPLAIAPATPPAALSAMPFEFAIVIAVRKTDQTLKREIDEALANRRRDIDAILAAYNVPRSDANVPSSDAHVPRSDAPSTVLSSSCAATRPC